MIRGNLLALALALVAAFLGGAAFAVAQAQGQTGTAGAAGGGAAWSRFVGTLTALRVAEGELEVRADQGGAQLVLVTSDTQVQRIPPGEKDLRNAVPMPLQEAAVGDRVLVTRPEGSLEARRILVMPSTEIARRKEADRQDWARRGISGVVAEKSGNEVKLRMRGLAGETQAVVTVSEKTAYRQYAPDSVKFADARPSSLDLVRPGDQLRARGVRSEDGVRVDAEEIVFGTFVTRAGTVTAVDVENQRVTLKELGTNEVLAVMLNRDSQLKKMPSFGEMAGGGGLAAAGGPLAGRTGGHGPAGQGPGAAAGGQRMAPGAGMGPGMRAGGGAPDLTQMLERMPSIGLDKLQTGETIVVSSTVGAKKNELTAIIVLSNAGTLVQMAQAQAAASVARGQASAAPAPNLGGLATGLTGLDLSGFAQ